MVQVSYTLDHKCLCLAVLLSTCDISHVYLFYLQPNLGLGNVYGQYNNGVLYCTFTRQKGNLGQPEMFDLEQDWHIMFAHGPVMPVAGRWNLLTVVTNS